MSEAKRMFEPGSNKLSVEAKNEIKKIITNLEVNKIIDLISYTPNPNSPVPKPGPWPWPYRNNITPGPPWPEPCVYNNLFSWSYPDPDDVNPWPWPLGPLVRDFISDLLIDRLMQSPLNKESFSVLDAIKREGIAYEAFNEISNKLNSIQKDLSIKLKKLG